MSHASSSSSPSVPLVDQLGFAGARKLYDVAAHPYIHSEAFESAAVNQLIELLKNLPKRLGLPKDSRHFFCGISQIAFGGDTVFTRACQELGILQRIFLPQPLDSYLSEEGSRGADFTVIQQATVKSLLASEHIIQTRVVSDSDNRHERFRDVNHEIARVSDVVICLVRAGQTGKAGGTHELAELASRRNRHVILLEISVGTDGNPILTMVPNTEGSPATSFTAPSLPKSLGSVVFPHQEKQGLPTGRQYCDHLKSLGSGQANRLRFHFKWAALIIVLGHVLATVLAVSSLKLSGGVVVAFLVVELLLLSVGLLVHYRLHHTHSLARWAAFRLVAEIARSMKAIGTFPVYLEHFFTLPFPPDFRAMVRTISVLHLRDTARNADAWETHRTKYVEERLRDPSQKAQIPYNQTTRVHATTRLKLAQRIFYCASFTTLLAILAKLLIKCECFHAPHALKDALGCIAIIFPVLAVAALSLAAAFDLEAKTHTSEELIAFLENQACLLKNATTSREFAQLLVETESRLLGETVNWYARRSFVGVA